MLPKIDNWLLGGKIFTLLDDNGVGFAEIIAGEEIVFFDISTFKTI
jgi:hypothetical protein